MFIIIPVFLILIKSSLENICFLIFLLLFNKPLI